MNVILNVFTERHQDLGVVEQTWILPLSGRQVATMLETPSRHQREVWTSLSAVVRYTQRLSKAALQGEDKQDVSCTSYQKMRG